MKNYEDITERVFRKGDKILEKKRRRTAIIKRTSLAVSGICAVVLVSFGVWKNNDIKNAVNNYSGDYQIITENDESVTLTSTEKPIQTSVTEPEKYTTVTYAKTTSPDITENQIIPSQTTTATSISGNSVYTTTIPARTSQAIQTEMPTTTLQETIQTTISTIPQTDLIVTETTITSQNIDDERSFYMKKLTSIMSALTLAAVVAPISGNAVYQIDTTRYWKGEKEIFAKMESGEFDTDINGNGEFDIFDCYTLECYLKDADSFAKYENSGISSEIINRINAITDYDSNGEITYNDEAHLIRYFIISGNLKREHLEPSYYEPTADTSLFQYGYLTNKPEYSFTNRVWNNAGFLLAGYDVIAEMCDNGTIDVDFNEDGQLDTNDIFDIYAYSNSVNLSYNDPLSQNAGYPGTETAKNLIPENEWIRCNEAYSHYPCSFIPGSYDSGEFAYYVTVYITAHMELKPEYFTKEYYEETISNYVPAYGLHVRVREAAISLGLKEDEYAWTKFDSDEFDPFFEAYCNDIENGLRPAPDINMDGTVDYIDYFDANIYYSDLLNFRSAEESILPEETWNNLSENCDFNGDGVSSDIYDITAIQLYIVKYIDEPDNFDESYKEYKESLSVSSENVFESLSYEDNVSILLSLDTERSGDANNDENVNIADAVLIMQSISNPDEYALTTKAQFNADVYNTGDGITSSDALQIQMWQAEKK